MDSIQEGIRALSVQFLPFMIAVVVHEYGHGLIALKWGDPTAKDAGRLTLNPVPHIDPIGTLLFPIVIMLTGMSFLFGWARPVPINPTLFKKYRPGLFWVSFAGPGMNFLLAVFSAAFLCAIVKWVPEDFYFFEPLVAMSRISVFLNFALGIFNLLPLPPLDGSKMIQSFLSPQATIRYESMARFSLLLLLVLAFSGAFRYLMIPIQFCSSVTLYFMGHFFGILP